MKSNSAFFCFFILLAPALASANNSEVPTDLDEDFLRFLLEFSDDNGDYIDPNTLESMMKQQPKKPPAETSSDRKEQALELKPESAMEKVS
ncbi:hypothetical protein TDB9533_03743 [Thalassocella blandensis]|nr:hypothetical protein TDB9533_03743 [Thalassocella blandensis]